METGISIHLHGWETLESGDIEYCDDPKRIDGWSVYIRRETPDDPQQPFDVSNSVDFSDQSSAVAHAQGLARCLFCDADEWNHD